MSKRKSNNKEKKKASQFVIRVDKAERDAFVKLCDKLDTSAAKEIRRFMRQMVAEKSVKDGDATVEECALGVPDTAGTSHVAQLLQESDVQTAIEVPSAEPAKSKRKSK